ncbi:MAG: DNA gyrase subunit alpha [Parcubacteria group bacterium Gr01-1014_72]|nr:MAG: DNA gyrase subunit alpha [Parcubacteria group bacterium Gr01-1014_72]
MASERDKKPPVAAPPGGRVVAREISSEMRESYLDYAMSVITARALPDVRDGLKPVHRRILYSMHEKGLTVGGKTKKSATVVGDVIGSYHPHGDAAVYDALVKMAQNFVMRYPLVIGQGNFGSLDGDPAAAYRYTEAKMSRLASELLRDIGKDTVDFRPNYDASKKEPVVMPSAVPNLLLNGTLGIAVGMATNMPPHNLAEVVAASVHLIDHPHATVEDLMRFVQGPDFPVGGIVYGEKDLRHAYTHGKGSVVTRGVAEIVEDKKGQYQIVITQIPYRVNKAELISKIADLAREKKLEGIRGLRDESTKDIRIVIELKQGSYPEKVLNYLYKHTQLEESFHYNCVALVDGVPETLSLKGILECFIAHRIEVVRRRSAYDLRQAEEREHILLGLTKALDHIDEVIKLIKKSKDVPSAHAGLMSAFRLSERQATAILEMKLQRLASLERKKLEDELKSVQGQIKELKEILASPAKVQKIIKDELTETAGGYIKRTNPDEYRKQRRGGVGVVDLDTKEEDFITHLLYATTHSDLLFFTDKGKVYQIKMYEIPEGKRATKGKSAMNFLSLAEGERITSILPMPKDKKTADGLSLMMVTKHGTGKKTSAVHFRDVRRSGLIAITLDSGDELISTSFVSRGDQVVIVTKDGQSIRFKETDVREMGRAAGGVRVIRLAKKDSVISADLVSKDAANPALFVMSATGHGKKTALKEYKTQKRGGRGILTAKITAKTGPLMAAKVVTDEDAEVVAMSKKSQVVRVNFAEIPTLSRATQGVRIMKLREGDSIASLTCL